MFDQIFYQLAHFIETSSENFELEIIEEGGIDVVKSTNPSLPLLCRLRVEVVEHEEFVTSFLVFSVFIIIGVVLTKLKNKRTKMMVERVRDEVKEDRINEKN